MQNKYTSPKYKEDAFNCPHCGAYSNQKWTWEKRGITNPYGMSVGSDESYYFAQCARCDEYSIWLHKEMIFPYSSGVEPINEDAPDNVKKDYEEASKVLYLSPKSANALLRLALQKLCIHLGADDDKLDVMIGQLVKEKGLSVKIQKAMDAIRIYGNDSVHIGEIRDSDTVNTAIKMFHIINIIIENMITDEKLIDELMSEVGDGQIDHIRKRDSKKVAKLN